MIDDRLKRVRARTLDLFDDELARGTPYDRAMNLALDAHFEAARRLCPNIDRELDAVQDLMEERQPPPVRRRRDRMRRSGTASPNAAPRGKPASPAASEKAEPKPVLDAEKDESPNLPSEPPKSDQPKPEPPKPEPSKPPEPPRPVPRSTPAPAPRRTPMDDRIEKARAATIGEFEQFLRRGQPRDTAIEDALDNHFDRIERLCDDPDAELEAMTAILRKHTPSAASRPNAAPSGRPASRHKGQPRPKPADTDLTSPYRFVELNDRVMEPEAQVLEAGLDKPLDDGLCGTITVKWVAETPLLIGEEGKGKDEGVVVPMTMGGGSKAPYVIPGATIRGCLRAALEIVASGRLAQINAHARFGLRDFDHPRIRPPGDENASLLARDKVKAGWLYKTDRTTDKGDPIYEIEPCKGWKTIAIADLPFCDRKNKYEWRAYWLSRELGDRYQLLSQYYRRAGKKPFSVGEQIRFSDMDPMQFRALGGSKTVGEVVQDPKGDLEGYLVFSNSSPAKPSAAVIESLERQGRPGQPKKREYVFLKSDGQKRFDVPDKAWKRFLVVNSKVAKNGMTPDGSWAVLAPSLNQSGGRIPVFYIGDPKDDESFEFGLTRFFKVAHEFSVSDMRDRIFAHQRLKVEGQERARVDLVEALFGHVLEPDEALVDEGEFSKANALERKGRVAFGFATIKQGAAVSSERVRTVMAAPRASYAPFYLKGVIKDWSASEREGTTLAGRKRYLPRFPHDRLEGAWGEIKKAMNAVRLQPKSGETEQEKRDTETTLRFLKPVDPSAGIAFTGKIRLHNVSPVELGALLWVLTHGGDPDKPYRHMMGRAKPFGAGQVRVRALTLDLKPNRPDRFRDSPKMDWERLTKPDTPEERGWLTEESWSLQPFLEAFHSHMEKLRPKWPRTRDMVEFLAACDPRVGAGLAEKASLAYPDLKTFAEVRKGCKLSTRFAPPEDRRTRYLPALADGDAERRVATVRLPYWEKPAG